MTIQDIQTRKEDQTFDCKSIQIEPKALVIPIIAFANADGAFVWITFKRPSSVTNLDTPTQQTEECGQKTTQKTTQKLSKKQEEIFAFLKNNPKASRKDLTENIAGLTEDGVKYNLKRLKELGLIRRIGPDKGGFWEIIE